MPKIIDLPEIPALDGTETVLLEKDGQTGRGTLWAYIRAFREWLAPIFTRAPGDGLPASYGGYLYLQNAMSGGLAGNMMLAQIGTSLAILEAGGTNRGVHVDLATAEAGFTTRLLTDRDLRNPTFGRNSGGLPANWGGGFAIQRPASDTTLAGDVSVTIQGDRLMFLEGAGVQRFAFVNLTRAQTGAGSEIAFLDDIRFGPTFERPPGLPGSFGGFVRWAKALTSTLAGPLLAQSQDDKWTLVEDGGDRRGFYVDIADCDPDGATSLLTAKDLVGVKAIPFSLLWAYRFRPDLNMIHVDAYHGRGTVGADVGAGGGPLIRVPAGPATPARTQAGDGSWWEVPKTAIIDAARVGLTGGERFADLPDETEFLTFLCDEWADVGQIIYLRRPIRVSSPEAFRNKRGCRFVGPGDIVCWLPAHPDGPSQYAGHYSLIDDDDHLLDSCGEEYLIAPRNWLRSPVMADRNIDIFNFADSRTAAVVNPYDGSVGNGSLFDAINDMEFIVPQIGLDIGLQGRLNLENLAVPGTTMAMAFAGNTADGSSWPNSTDGTTPIDVALYAPDSWIWFGFGPNEINHLDDNDNRPGTVDDLVRQVVEDYHNMFAQIRAIRPVERTPITFWGPTTASHARFQTADYYRKLVPALKRLCRLHQIHYVDMLSIWSDSRRMAGKTLDLIYNLHFNDAQQEAYYGRMRDVLDRALTTGNITNRNINPPSWVETKTATAKPSTYVLGRSRHEVTAADGWPADGLVITERSGGGAYADQVFRAAATGARQERWKASGSDTWQAWS